MPELLQDTISVTVDGIDYLFSIPTFADEIKIGLCEREIRRSIEQEVLGPEQVASGAPTGDFATEFLIRTAANFRILLRRCSSEWPYSPGTNGQPVIDFNKWPRDKVSVAAEVGARLNEEIARFRQNGTSDRNAVSGEAVAVQPDTTFEPIRSGTPQS